VAGFEPDPTGWFYPILDTNPIIPALQRRNILFF
jgi:hypothetical protein